MRKTSVTVHQDSCSCSGRSQSFPARLECVVLVRDEANQAAFHWRRDGAGWEPCATDEAAWMALQRVAIELGLPYTSLAAYSTATRAAAEVFNRVGIEHWRALFLRAVDQDQAHARRRLGLAMAKLKQEQSHLLLAECRARAARIRDPALAAAAHQLLAQTFAGSPAELLATAEAVLRP